MIVTEDLTRIYTRKTRKHLFSKAVVSNFTAVDHLSLEVKAGERVAFIGPNGAGKTTTLRMLTGLLYPTSGRVMVNGLIPWVDRKTLARSIGLVFGQRSQLWADLPVSDSFQSMRVIYGIDPVVFRQRHDDLCERLMIGDFLHQPVRSLSLGQRMRCEIAAALLHQPKILFLDEPTIGLDVDAKAILRDYLKTLHMTEDMTIILTSHDTGDIEDICERVVMIDHGRKLLDQPLWMLQRDFDAGRRLVVTTHEKDPVCSGFDGMIEEVAAHRVVLNVDTRTVKLSDIILSIQKQMAMTDLVIERTPLETIIRRLYARGQAEG